MRKKALSALLEEISQLKTKDEKIAALKQNDNSTIRLVLQGMYDPRVEWLLPEGVPPYKPNLDSGSEGFLLHESRKLYLFVKGGNDGVHQIKREKLFIDILEFVHPDDAKLLLQMKEKKPIKGITKEIIGAAYPELF